MGGEAVTTRGSTIPTGANVDAPAQLPGGLRLAAIPAERYADYRYEVIFEGYKWDPKVEDHNTVARHALLLAPSTARELERLAEQLALETVRMEGALLERLPLARQLGLPRRILSALARLRGYDAARHVRLMRFDFHPTADGWRISEVNSDVPGGLAEASVLPGLAARYFPGYEPRHHLADRLLESVRSRIGDHGRLAFVHATSYSDDRQVMEFLGDHFASHGYTSVMAAPDHIRWRGRRAFSIVEGQEGPLDGILRFFPLEWLANLPRSSGWQGFYDGDTLACNHPIAMLTQSKRLPLIWDKLGVELAAWKQMLPDTRDPRRVPRSDMGWVLKPALGRVGERILIEEAVSQRERRKIERSARWFPGRWIAQRRFASEPLNPEDTFGSPGAVRRDEWHEPLPSGEPPLSRDESGKYHVCIGVFTVDGRCAGFYGRISPYARIDHRAVDIPVLVAKEGEEYARE